MNASMVFSLQDEIPTETAVRIYDIFEYFTEELLGFIEAAFLKITENDNYYVMRIMLGTRYEGKKIDIERLSGICSCVNVEYSDADVVADVLLSKEAV